MLPSLGILISISIITALSLAVYENPQIQAWLEEQRQRLVELLRSVGEQLDPAQRRMAEAFAYEGRTPATDEGLRREASGSQEAAALATGRSMSNASTIRRITINGPSDPDEAEERRRRGREYLARRNEQMYEMQQRRKGKAKMEDPLTPPSPTSFDAMVDDEGKLRLSDEEVQALPDPPMSVPVLEDEKAEMRELEPRPILAAEPSAPSWWQIGSRMANPFDDENVMDMERSETPKPAVPPKIALDDEEDRGMPGSFTPRPSSAQRAEADLESSRANLSYEEQEQLAIAISLSEAEHKAIEDVRRRESQVDEDAELRAAIAASLKDQRSSAASASTPQAPLIDITESAPSVPMHHPIPRGHWETLFDQEYSPTREPLSVPQNAGARPSVEEDELYRVTPQLTRARLASLDALSARLPTLPTLSHPYDPVREAAAAHQPQAAMEESFYSAASPARSQTLERETPQLVDTTIPTSQQEPQTPSTLAFETDSEASNDTFASISAPASRAPFSAAPSTRHEESDVEVVDITNDADSDIDMLSEADGVRTPDSWTEVGSQDGESESEAEVWERERRMRDVV